MTKRRAPKAAPPAPAPPPIVAAPTGAYVRLPLPPELLSAFGEYVAHGQRLYDLLTRADASVGELGQACLAAARTIERDAPRVSAVLARRRTRR